MGDDVGKLFARDIQMRHQTHNRRGVNQDIPFPQIVAKRGGLCFANANKQHIRFVAYDLRARFPKLLRQLGGVIMILLQTRHVMLQRIQSGRCQNPGLTHSAADHFTPARRAFNVIAVADQQ